VRGRGLAMFAIVLFGSMSEGSALWGQVAPGSAFRLRIYRSAAPAGGTAASLALEAQTGQVWICPVASLARAGARRRRCGRPRACPCYGEYRVPAQNQRRFWNAMTELKRQRRRDGAYHGASTRTRQRPSASLRHFISLHG